MSALVENLLFEQGIGRLYTPPPWADRDGNIYALGGYTARLQVRSLITDATPVIDLSSANGKIVITEPDVVCAFSSADVSLLAPIANFRPGGAILRAAPTYLAGVFELRLTSAGGYEYSVVRGNVFLRLGAVQ